MNENIPQYGDILYLVNILNEECEEYKIIEVTQKQQPNHGKLFYRCRITRTESWLSDMMHYLDYYLDDNGYFIDFLGAMIPIPVMDKVQKARYRLGAYKKKQKAAFKNCNGMRRMRYLTALFSLQREILGFDTPEDETDTKNISDLRYYYCYQPNDTFDLFYLYGEIIDLAKKIVREIFPCDENDIYYNNEQISKFCNIIGDGNTTLIVTTHQYKGDWARNFDSNGDFRNLPEENYYYQKNFNAKIIESDEYPRGFGIVMRQNLLNSGFKECINLDARMMTDMPPFIQTFAYEEVNVDYFEI